VKIKTKQILDQYLFIRNEIDRTCDRLHQEHKENTKCRKGCSDCCMNFSLLPVEFISILEEIKDKEVKLNIEDKDKCLFLSDGTCQIYAHRPSICRSHGLPILNMDEEGENMELSFCPLNFQEVEIDYFTMENGYQQDTFNSKLYLVNKEFVNSYEDEKFTENQLIDLRELSNYLKK
jgi:Fe-S-cluster containining protein